jgi:hypothetical protein
MKKFLLLLLVVFAFVPVKAQSPNKISYQAVIRGASNNLIFNSMVTMRFSILQGSETGNILYVETQKPTTNNNGLVSVVIGNGVPVSGILSDIDWSKGPFFLKTETNPLGGSSYTVTGTTQLLSVPYALYSGQAENVSGKITIAHGGTGAANVTEARYNLGIDIDSTRVAAEIARAKGAETVLTTNLSTEVSRATTAEGVLATNQATETINRTNADATKESLVNKSINITTDETSDTKYPSVKSVKTYVDSKVVAASPDATALLKGKVQLGGDLGGAGTSASAPVISENAITTVKILDANITTSKIADASVTNAKLAGSIDLTTKVTGALPVANGGTG